MNVQLFEKISKNFLKINFYSESSPDNQQKKFILFGPFHVTMYSFKFRYFNLPPNKILLRAQKKKSKDWDTKDYY